MMYEIHGKKEFCYNLLLICYISFFYSHFLDKRLYFISRVTGRYTCWVCLETRLVERELIISVHAVKGNCKFSD